MFYFLFRSSLIWHYVLIAAAILPAVFLMVRVYRSDRLEKESKALLGRCVRAGILATLIAMASERIGELILGAMIREDMPAYDLILYFLVVAGAEEGAKYLMLRRNTWNDQEFDCLYDGVVYAVFVSLGFALWENISYVLHYGMQSAFIRAVTAVPGHTCFGVFMGLFYGKEKMYAVYGATEKAKASRWLSIVLPVILHGAYDYIASMETTGSEWIFILFVASMFAFAWFAGGKASHNDRFI